MLASCCEPGFRKPVPLHSPTNVFYHPSMLIVIYTVYINVADSVNYVKVIQTYLLLVVNLCHKTVVYAFLLHFVLIVSPCFDMAPFPNCILTASTE